MQLALFWPHGEFLPESLKDSWVKTLVGESTFNLALSLMESTIEERIALLSDSDFSDIFKSVLIWTDSKEIKEELIKGCRITHSSMIFSLQALPRLKFLVKEELERVNLALPDSNYLYLEVIDVD